MMFAGRSIRRLLRLPATTRSKVEREVDEEIQTHIDLHAAWLVQQGWSASDARTEAERRFGEVGAARSMLHDAADARRRILLRRAWWQDLGQDAHFALRTLRRSPVLTMVATVVLGLGIGVNAAVFSVFESVVLRPLPYQDAARLAAVWRTPKTASEFIPAAFDTYRDFTEWRKRSHSFTTLAALTWARGGQAFRPANGPPRWVLAVPASENFFDLLGVHAALGRTFSASDLQRSCTVVLAHTFWRDVLSADSTIVGRPLAIGDKSCDVIGVMPPTFEFYPRKTELWTLMTPAGDTTLARHPSNYITGVFGRLRPGVTLADAQQELRAIQDQAPGTTSLERDLVPLVHDLQREFTWLAGRNLRTTLVLLLVTVGLVLLVACANIASLLLGRAVSREREFAVRIALGSGRSRLVRQLLTESAMLSAFGVVAGVGIATALIRYLNSGAFLEIPPEGSARLDGGVAAIIVFLCVVATLGAGALPARRATRVNTADALKSSGRGSTHTAGWPATALVLAQMAVSVTLLVCAGLVIESLERLHGAPLGYSPEHVITAGVMVPTSDTLRFRHFETEVLDRLQAHPTTESAAVVSGLPVYGMGNLRSVAIDGRPAETTLGPQSVVGEEVVSSGYFDVLRIPKLAGRTFDANDSESGPPVAIVNREFVRQHFGAINPIGHRVQLDPSEPGNPWLTVVGVVGNEQRAIVSREMGWSGAPIVFRPYTQATHGAMYVLVRSTADVASITRDVRNAVTGASSDAIITEVAPMTELVDRFLQSPRTRAELLALLAVLALMLSVVGLYGLLAQLAVQRTREIGIRVALGAKQWDVVGLVVGKAMVLTIAGILIGCALALPAARVIHALLYGTGPFDPTTLAVVVFVLVFTGAAASFFPARHAASVDPLIALRAD